MMRRYGDLMASVGEFTDQDGRKAKRWLKVGVVMRDSRNGSLSVKLDAVPVLPGWSGWLAVRNVGEESHVDE
ncbi:MAG: hypothetical protein JJU27_13990 [Gammaproteobacteria bacterium]|nr:hypothetical protein [Gammaproteobacteria bacterium]